MRPVDFKGTNAALRSPENWNDEILGPCETLPVRRTDGMCVSCWDFSWKERLKVLFGGSIALYMASEETHPPVYLDVLKKEEI